MKKYSDYTDTPWEEILLDEIQSAPPDEWPLQKKKANRLRAIGAVLVLGNVLAWIFFLVTYLVWGQ